MKENVAGFLENLKEVTGKQVSFLIATDNCIINVNGKFRKYGNQYSFTKGKRRFVIEKRRAGRLWSWKGTYNEYWVDFIESGETLMSFKIPKGAKIQFDEEEEL